MKRNLFYLIAIITFGLSWQSADAQTYCTTGLYTTGCSVGDQILDVTIGSFNHPAGSTSCSPNGFGDFTNDTIILAQGTVSLATITHGPTYSQGDAIWIDFNDDGDWADAGEHLWSSPGSSLSNSGNITIPLTADTGYHRLRVRCIYASTVSSTQSCSSTTYGEAQDYTVYIGPPPACPAPIYGNAQNVGATTAWIYWQSNGTAFNIEYGPAGFSQGTGTVVTSTADSVQLTGLTANTYYDVYIQNNCTSAGNGTSLWSSPVNFKTLCVPFATPYDEDFDSTPAGNYSNRNYPDCWAWANNSGAIGYGYVYNYVSNSPSNSYYMYNSGGGAGNDTIMLISPEIQGLDSATKMLTFWATDNSTFNAGDLRVGTVSSQTDYSSFNEIAHINVGDTWTEYILYLDSATMAGSSDKFIAFMHGNTNTYTSVYIDDVELENIPACPFPVNFTANNITSSSAVVNWSANGTAFNIEYGPSGFTQGTGTFTYPNQTTDTLTGLFSNTVYDVYIQSDCQSSGNGTSTWSGPFSFLTLCSALTPPIFEDFDNTPTGNSSTPSAPSCWDYAETQGHPGYGYTYQWGSPYSSPNHWYMYNSNGYPADTQMLVSPEIMNITTNNVQVSFYGYTSSTFNSGGIVVGTMTDPSDASTFTAMDTMVFTSTSAYYISQLGTADGYNGTDTYVALAHYSQGTYVSVYLDDIKIEEIPQCFPSGNMQASNVTQTTALIQWTPGQGTSYELEYGVTGFVQGTGAPIVTGITDSSQTITGLSANACFDVYIRDSCASGFSPWFGPMTFCTPCNPQATPILEDFANALPGSSTNPSMPDCWTFAKTDGAPGYGYTYQWGTPVSSPNHFFMSNSNSVSDTIAIVSPDVQGLDSANKEISFWSYSWSTGAEVYVGTVNSANDASSFEAVDTVVLTGGNTYTQYSVYLDTISGKYNGVDKFVAIAHVGGGTYQSIYLDDIEITTIPTCSAPFNLMASNITSSSADAEWTSLFGTNFKVEYDVTGFIQGTGLGMIVNNTTSPASMTGLSPNTYYDFYVTDKCDSSVWAGPYTFKTECLSTLSGSYTVGGTSGTNNFATLDSALSVLNGCGISGPVTLTLMGGTHTGPLKIMDVAGVNSTNTITISGGGVSVDTIRTLGADAGCEIYNTNYVTISNLTIDNSTGSRGVWLHGDVDNVEIDNCHIYSLTGSSSSNTGGIIISGLSTSIYDYTSNVSNLTVTDCKLSGGYWGMVIQGRSQANKNGPFLIENNEMVGVYGYGIRCYYTDGAVIRGNSVPSTTSTFGYGYYIYYSDNFIVDRNSAYVTGYALYSYWANGDGNATSSSVISNNMFGCTGTYGMYLSSCQDLDIFHNSISGGSYGFYPYNGTNFDIRNNIFNGGSYPIYSSSFATYTNVDFDYNLYSGSNVAYWGGSYHSTLSSWQTADSTMNQNSVEGASGFISTTDFHQIGTLANDVGDNTVGILEDIDGDVRPSAMSTTVDMGADEYDVLADDAGVVGLINPSDNTCGDSAIAVTVEFFNYGTDTITSMDVAVEVLGQTLSATYNGVLPSGASDTLTVGSFTQISGANVMFRAYTELANDQKASNDTMTFTRVIADASMPVGMAMMDTVCSGDSTALYITSPSEGNFMWTYSNGDTLALATASDTVYTPALGMDTTLTLTAVSETFKIGNPDNTTGASGGGNYTFFNGTGLTFDVFKTITIDSVLVYPNSAGDVYVNVANSSGTILQTAIASVTATANTPERIYVGLTVTPGSYELIADGTTTTGLYRGFGYTNYPLVAANGSMSITGATNGTYYNYFFYDWDVSAGGCDRPTGEVTIDVLDAPIAAFNFTTGNPTLTDLTVDFDGTTSMYADSIVWNFGDGNFGAGDMPQHMYTSNGSYTVTCYAFNQCGVDSVSQMVTIAGIGIDEGLIGETLNIYPNPNDGIFRMDFQLEGLKDIKVRVIDAIGKEVYFTEAGKVSGTYRENIDISSKAKGLYVIQIISDDVVVSRKITVQ